jgi:hypothetical protein
VALSDVLTIAKLSRWSINYYNDTANAVGQLMQAGCSSTAGTVKLCFTAVAENVAVITG